MKKLTRREFVAAAGGSLVSIGLPGTFYKLSAGEYRELSGALRPDGRPRIPPGQEPVKTLHDMGGTPGPGPVPSWELKIHGEVETPLTLNLDQLKSMDRTQLKCDVHCVTGWSLLGSRWGGIRLSTLMTHARIKKSARFVIFEAPNGYSSNIPMEEALKDNVLLADTFEGVPLSLPHGAPYRALVPDLYFWKSAKWIQGVRFTVEDEPGYYESGGYSNSADPWKEERFVGND